MAYPPELPPSSRTNSTLMATNHALDHNKVAAALEDLVEVLGADPSGAYADLTSRLADALLSETDVADTVGTDGPLDAALSASYASILSTPPGAAAMGLRARLAGGITTGIAVIGDSTGNDTNEWAALVANSVATAHPEFTVQHALWDDTAQDCLPATVLQTGTAGIQYLDTTSHTVCKTMAQADTVHTPGVLDIRVKASLTSWTAPAAMSILAARNGDAPNRSWYFGIATSGKPVIYVSTDGSALLTKAASTALTTTANTVQWVRVVYTPSTDVKFYTSTNGTTWTQLGSTVTNTDGALYNATAPYELGGRGGATSSNSAKIYEVDIRNGLNGTPLVPRLPALWPASQRVSATVVGAPTFTLVNGSQPGADLAYWTTTYIGKALPKFGQALGFVSLSHNELDWYGPNFAPRFAAKVTDIKATLGTVPLIYLTQNPQVSPRAAEMILGQTRRHVDIIMEAAKAKDAAIDTYAALAADTATYVQADGIHPTTAGSQLWANTVRAAIGL